MSTRCRLLNKITKQSSFVHFDGYPSGVGHVLLKKYTNDEMLVALFSVLEYRTLGLGVSVPYSDPIRYNDEDCDFTYAWGTDVDGSLNWRVIDRDGQYSGQILTKELVTKYAEENGFMVMI